MSRLTKPWRRFCQFHLQFHLRLRAFFHRYVPGRRPADAPGQTQQHRMDARQEGREDPQCRVGSLWSWCPPGKRLLTKARGLLVTPLAMPEDPPLPLPPSRHRRHARYPCPVLGHPAIRGTSENRRNGTGRRMIIRALFPPTELTSRRRLGRTPTQSLSDSTIPRLLEQLWLLGQVVN